MKLMGMMKHESTERTRPESLWPWNGDSKIVKITVGEVEHEGESMKACAKRRNAEILER